MKNLLLEEIEKYKRLSNYNPKMTLTENIKVISERNIGPKMKELMSATKITKLLEKDAKSFQKEWAKAFQRDIEAGFRKGELGPLGKELSKIELFRTIGNEARNKGRALTVEEINILKDEVKASSKSKAAEFVGTATKDSKIAAPPKVFQLDDVKVAAEPIAAEPLILNIDDFKVAEDAVTKNPGLKKLDWKNLLKWGGVTSVSIGALYLIYKKTHKEEPPVIVNNTETPTPTPTPLKNRYRNCDNEPKYTKGCRTSPDGPIGQLQRCLGGLVIDGKFWNKTELALKKAGYPNGVTNDDIKNICNKKPTPTPTPAESEFEDIDGEDASSIIDN